MIKKFLLAATTIALALPLSTNVAFAQDESPSYAEPEAPAASADVEIRGRVESFDGGYSLQVRDERGYDDVVQLHQGTIINPTGLTLEPGMVVSIIGYNAGNFFAANEIDTPYQYDSGVPYYLGHPYNYYGPSFGLDFFFGAGNGWYHPGFFGGGFSYIGGARRYNNVNFNVGFGGRGYGGGYGYRGGYGGGYEHAGYNGGQRAALGYNNGHGAYQPSHYGAPAGGSHGSYGGNAGGYHGSYGGNSGFHGTPGANVGGYHGSTGSTGSFRGAQSAGRAAAPSGGGFHGGNGGGGFHGGGGASHGGGSHGGGGHH
jgi:hypothetical protein